MPVSADTLIRQAKRAAHLSALPQVRVLGVDDWAWCKGQTFGTILVDMECSQVVDLQLAALLRKSMTNQLSHANLFSDLGNVTLRRAVKTDKG